MGSVAACSTPTDASDVIWANDLRRCGGHRLFDDSKNPEVKATINPATTLPTLPGLDALNGRLAPPGGAEK
jgi:hypothetical protein